MEVKQLIRELRFGKPKTWKTSSVVGSYPEPLLLFNFDPDGFTSVSGRTINLITSEDFRAALLNKEFKWNTSQVWIIDYTAKGKQRISSDQFKNQTQAPLQRFITDCNALFDNCPFKTVVLDSTTMLNGTVLEFVCQLNSVKMPTLPLWGQILGKLEEIVGCLCSLPCHLVMIAHEDSEKDELTGEISLWPMFTGQMKKKVGMLVNQYLYATTETGGDGKTKGVIYTQPRGLMKGIGMRFPQNRPPVCGPRFSDVYGVDFK
jgi:hypothetical protein